MARIRTVKPELSFHEGLFDLEVETGLPIRFVWAMLPCHCDREGRFKWKPRSLKAQILPYDDVDLSRVLDALWTRGFIEKYHENNEEYGCIPTFLDHQVINNKERESTLPKPSKNNTLSREKREVDALPTREERVTQGREGKGKEGNSKKHMSNSANLTYDDVPDFLQFWSAYPRKDDKKKSFQAWLKAKPDIDVVLSALAWQVQSDQWSRQNGQFVPLGETYINGARWEAEPPNERAAF